MTRLMAVAGSAILVLMAGACAPSYDAVLPEPVQGPIQETGAVLDGAGRIRRIATFRSKTLVLKRKDYDRDLVEDPMSEFAPVDMVMAWGRAGLKSTREGVSLAQGRRRYGWRAGGEAWAKPDVQAFGSTTANWHLIPADEAVAEQLEDVDVGDVVEITGDLVAVTLAGGTVARSSTVRDDARDGACEIVRVTAVIRS